MTQQQQLIKEIEYSNEIIIKLEKLIDWTSPNLVRNYILIEAIKILDMDVKYYNKCLEKLIKQQQPGFTLAIVRQMNATNAIHFFSKQK